MPTLSKEQREAVDPDSVGPLSKPATATTADAESTSPF